MFNDIKTATIHISTIEKTSAKFPDCKLNLTIIIVTNNLTRKKVVRTISTRVHVKLCVQFVMSLHGDIKLALSLNLCSCRLYAFDCAPWKRDHNNTLSVICLRNFQTQSGRSQRPIEQREPSLCNLEILRLKKAEVVQLYELISYMGND